MPNAQATKLVSRTSAVTPVLEPVVTMPDAKQSIIMQSVTVLVATLVILSLAALSFLKQSLDLTLLTHAILPLVEPMQSALQEERQGPADVSQNILVTHMLAAGQSVSSTLSAPTILPVSRRSVEIPALAPVEEMLSVQSGITTPSVPATQDTLEMQPQPVLSSHHQLLPLPLTPVILIHVAPTASTERSMECVSVPASLATRAILQTADQSVW